MSTSVLASTCVRIATTHSSTAPASSSAVALALVAVSAALKEQGAKEVSAYITHGVLSGKAVERIGDGIQGRCPNQSTTGFRESRTAANLEISNMPLPE